MGLFPLLSPRVAIVTLMRWTDWERALFLTGDTYICDRVTCRFVKLNPPLMLSEGWRGRERANVGWKELWVLKTLQKVTLYYSFANVEGVKITSAFPPLSSVTWFLPPVFCCKRLRFSDCFYVSLSWFRNPPISLTWVNVSRHLGCNVFTFCCNFPKCFTIARQSWHFLQDKKKRSHLEGIWWWKIVWLFEKQLDTLWNYDDRKDTELFFWYRKKQNRKVRDMLVFIGELEL